MLSSPTGASYLELRAHIDALLRRAMARPSRILRIANVAIDIAARTVAVGGKTLTLTNCEFQLLLALAADPERVFTKAELMRDVWGYATGVSSRTLDSHACRVRRKLQEAGAGESLLHNVWGVGYRLRTPNAALVSA